MKIEIATDIDGNPIHAGDDVIAEGVRHTIELGKHREKFGFGYVYGYYIPDFSRVCTTDTKEDEKD